MRKGSNSHPPEREFLIAYNIKALREKAFPGRGGPLKCSEALSISKYQYYGWENGTRTPRPNNLKALADFFGVTLERFTAIPKDWEHIHRRMLNKWYERAKIVPNPDDDPENEPDQTGVTESMDSAATGETTEQTAPTEEQALDSMDQMNAIIKLLMKKQVMVENGQMDPKKFKKALEELHSYTLYRLQD